MINCDDSVIEKDEFNSYSFEALDEFYHNVNNDPFSITSLAYKMQYSAIYYEAVDKRLSAKLCCYLAYYLFMWLKPACSCELAIHYIDKAMELDPSEQEYIKWKSLFEEGN